MTDERRRREQEARGGADGHRAASRSRSCCTSCGRAHLLRAASAAGAAADGVHGRDRRSERARREAARRDRSGARRRSRRPKPRRRHPSRRHLSRPPPPPPEQVAKAEEPPPSRAARRRSRRDPARYAARDADRDVTPSRRGDAATNPRSRPHARRASPTPRPSATVVPVRASRSRPRAPHRDGRREEELARAGRADASSRARRADAGGRGAPKPADRGAADDLDGKLAEAIKGVEAKVEKSGKAGVGGATGPGGGMGGTERDARTGRRASAAKDPAAAGRSAVSSSWSTTIRC